MYIAIIIYIINIVSVLYNITIYIVHKLHNIITKFSLTNIHTGVYNEQGNAVIHSRRPVVGCVNIIHVNKPRHIGPVRSGRAPNLYGAAT